MHRVVASINSSRAPVLLPEEHGKITGNTFRPLRKQRINLPRKDSLAGRKRANSHRRRLVRIAARGAMEMGGTVAMAGTVGTAMATEKVTEKDLRLRRSLSSA